MKTEAIKLIQQVEQKSFNEGFKAGWYAATKHIHEALKAPIMPAFEGNDHDHPEVLETHTQDNPFRKGTKSAQVYEYVRDNPGQRGTDIFKALGIMTKIGRTALYRMKDGGLAVNKDGWRLIR